MSPRVLLNTFARRQLIAGRSNEDMSRLLGLSGHRTAIRLRIDHRGCILPGEACLFLKAFRRA